MSIPAVSKAVSMVMRVSPGFSTDPMRPKSVMIPVNMPACYLTAR